MSDPIKVDFSDKGKGKGTSTGREILIPPEKAGLKIVLSLLITVIGGAVLYYFMLPPMNFRSIDFYIFWAVILVIFIAANVLTSKAFMRPEYVPYVKRVSIAPIVIAVALAAVLLVGYLSSCIVFRAKAFSEILTFSEQADIDSSVTKIDSTEEFTNVAMIDASAAATLADKVLGDLATIGLESQFDLATEYSAQINYKGSPCRVYPLRYGNVFKWLNNTSDGFPGYVIVNMNTQETRFVLLNGDGTAEAGTTADGYMKISPAEHFQKNLKRILRFEYPTEMFGRISFETNDSDTPYWICEVIEKKVGLIGGDNVKGVVMVDTIDGNCTYYSAEELTAGTATDENGNTVDLMWIDQVYDADLLVEQYNYYGTYNNGFWNSLFGQSGVKKTTQGSSYIAMNDDVYIYTGVTSVSSDNSILGFILINQRTKDATYYNTTGATELAAQGSAEGALSDKGWSATFPLLINLDGEATYFMALKDNNNVVKSYAMVNVGNYNIVATDSADGNPNLAACIENYAKALSDSKSVVIHVDTTVVPEIVTDPEGSTTTVETHNVTGTISRVLSQIENGATCYYVTLSGNSSYFKLSADEYPEAIFLAAGDLVTVTYTDTDVKSSWTEIGRLVIGEDTTDAAS